MDGLQGKLDQMQDSERLPPAPLKTPAVAATPPSPAAAEAAGAPSTLSVPSVSAARSIPVTPASLPTTALAQAPPQPLNSTTFEVLRVEYAAMFDRCRLLPQFAPNAVFYVPSEGEPPFTWLDSARDALTLKKLDQVREWSLPCMLYLLEAYNCFGYRPRGVPTPYLWSFSNLYSRGKYVADGRFDPQAVSKQCGAAVLLRVLQERGLV